MKHFFSFTLALFMILGCSSRPVIEKEETPTVHPSVKPREVVRNTPRIRPKLKTTQSLPPTLTEKELLPSILHSKDRSVMVLINSGNYLVGVTSTAKGRIHEKESAPAQVSLPAYYIDQREITVWQYKLFNPQYDEKTYTDNRECAKCPAMGIDWNSAYRYCRWAGKRLPSEAEWEAAARGPTSYLWPWGVEFDVSKANLIGDLDGALFAAPVGSYPQGASFYGVLDMAGNVWEWVSTPALITSAGGKQSHSRMVKGGGWSSQKRTSLISFRNIIKPTTKNPTFGFRCVRPVSEKTSPGN